MRRIAQLAIGLTVSATVIGLLAGCSGTGASTEPGDLTVLQAMTEAHLTSLLMLKSWFAILHTAPDDAAGAGENASCRPATEYPPPQPGDPPGATRVRHTLADCTVIDALWLSDGSGGHTIVDPQQRTSTLEWGALRASGGWMVQPLKLSLWNGAVMEWEDGGLPGSVGNQQRRIGNATLDDGREMDFRLQRSDSLDRLRLLPYDGSDLLVHVPLKFGLRTGYRPRFSDPATGGFESGGGAAYRFSMAGSPEHGWDTWKFSGDEGLVGSFTLEGDFSGAGRVTQGGRVVAALQW
ncbi:MAG: hypothetical protein FJX74_18815, partial [Armatimonadetes bacterium]|nr:hypothetical protein [Armatimonadota bacterium]